MDVAWRHHDVASSTDALEELRHEVRAALFGIEASAEGLRRGGGDLTPAQFDELTLALAAEARRLRALLDGDGGGSSSFDLAGAIEPVIASARSAGLHVLASVPRGITVYGRRDSTAQVVLSLLDNARHHAGHTPVEVRASVQPDAVTLRVEDRGPGISERLNGRLFERGVCGDESNGSGLGLFIARRLMVEQGGSIGISRRPGGGASFVLRFRRAAPASADCRG
jgi:two-component system OmpR family sensor kinase